VCSFERANSIWSVRFCPDDFSLAADPTSIAMPGAFDLARAGHGFAVAVDFVNSDLIVLDLRHPRVSLREHARISLDGIRNPSRVAVAADGRTIAVAGYGSSNLMIARMNEQLTDIAANRTISFTGRSVDPDRQEASHPHDVRFRGDEVLIADLGSDAIRIIRITDDLIPSEQRSIGVAPGSGPRHVAPAGGGRLLVSCELDSTIALVDEADDGPVAISVPSTSSPNGGGDRNYPSDVVYAASTGVGYVANRGQNTITAVRVGDGLELLSEVDSGADWPEAIRIVDDALIIAHSRGNAVTALGLGAYGIPDGRRATIAVPSAMAILVR
jgi:6-phosphogluconolactonase